MNQSLVLHIPDQTGRTFQGVSSEENQQAYFAGGQYQMKTADQVQNAHCRLNTKYRLTRKTVFYIRNA